MRLFKRYMDISIALSAVATLVLCGTASSADWPHWRGPNRNDTTPETSGWKEKAWPPKRIWHKKLGYGSTSPIVAKNRLYSAGWNGDNDTIFCLDAATGKEIWKKSYSCKPYGRHAIGDQGWYKGVASTPEFDPQTNYLYTLSTDGHLHCWTATDGGSVWSMNLYDKYKVPQRPGNRDYGYTSSPLVYDDWLIVEVGGKQGNLMAFDKRNGKLLWDSQCKDPAGHNAGPTPLTVRNIPCLAVFTVAGLHVSRIDRDNAGRTVATHPWVTDYNNNISSACVSADKAVISSGYNQNRIALFDLNLNGIAKIHEVKRDCSKVGTPVIYENHLYIPYEQLRCYRIDKNGLSLKWKGSRDKFDFGLEGSCIITGDGRLIVFGSKGSKHRLALIDIGGSQPSLLSSNEDVFAGVKRGRTRAWPHVVLANGRIYCKDLEGNLVCFALRR